MTPAQLELLLLLAQYHTLMASGSVPEIREAMEDVLCERDELAESDHTTNARETPAWMLFAIFFLWGFILGMWVVFAIYKLIL